MDRIVKYGLIYALIGFLLVLAVNGWRVYDKSQQIKTVLGLDSAGVVGQMGTPSDSHTRRQNGHTDSTVLVYRIMPFIHNEFSVMLDSSGKARRTAAVVNWQYN